MRLPRLVSVPRLSLPTLLAAAVMAVSACGSGGGSDPFMRSDGVIEPGQPGSTANLGLWERRTAASDRLAGVCAQPRPGEDRRGSLDDEKYWLRTYMDEVYLWYDEVPEVDSRPYNVANDGSVWGAMDAYFYALLTPEITSSGKYKDQFSFTYPTDEWEALSQRGEELGYGLLVAALSREVPRDYRIAFVDPAAPAGNKTVARGARILAIDGVSIDTTSAQGINTLNAGLFPNRVGEQHTFRVLDVGASAPRDVRLTAAAVTSTPVPNVRTLDTASGKVGYLLFNDHIATAEGALIAAIRQLRDAGIVDLVLDLRYNGGGYLDIASELAYMIAGPGPTRSKLFERLSLNDKHPLASVSSFTNTPFHTVSQGFDPAVANGSTLPALGFNRVYVLTGPGTCSASEAIINGLRGVNVEVVLIGETSCGKPYGFYAQDNCGLSYFAIEFAGVNAKNFGDYADGFAPECVVADDFSHALGDPEEARLAAALNLRAGGTCAATLKRADAEALQLLRSSLRENAYGRPLR